MHHSLQRAAFICLFCYLIAPVRIDLRLRPGVTHSICQTSWRDNHTYGRAYIDIDKPLDQQLYESSLHRLNVER